MALREKCPSTELFLVCIFLYYKKKRNRNNSVFGHFSRSVAYYIRVLIWGVRNVSFSENFDYELNEWSQVCLTILENYALKG